MTPPPDAGAASGGGATDGSWRGSPRRRGRSARRARPRSRTTASSRSRSQSSTTTPLAVEVALEVEQERLDPPLGAAVVRVDADRDRGAAVERRRRRRSRTRERAASASIRRFAVGKPSVPPRASPETTIPSTSSGRPSSGRGRADVARRRELPDPRRRDAVDDRHDCARRARAARSSVEVAAARPAEAEALAGDDDLGADRRAGTIATNASGSSAATSGVNSTTSVSSTPSSASSSSRRSSVRQQLDLVAEHLARVRVERHDRRQRRPASSAAPSTARWPTVDAVERADRDRARPPLELRRRVRDFTPASAAGVARRLERRAAPHARPAPARAPSSGSRASTSDDRRAAARGRPPRPGTGRPRSAAASCSGRRAPSAIDRTYVPELDVQLEPHARRPYTR